MTGVLARLPQELLSMLRGGASVLVGSRGADLRPSVVRAVGSDLDAQAGCVRVFLWRPQSVQLLRDIGATGHVAVVFSQPSSHQALQLKARQADILPVTPADRPLLQRYLASMEIEIGAVGFPPVMTRALLAHRHDELAVVRFAPEQAFLQTPGPRAGAAL
ncbi:MAG: hypothetical protein V4609_14230 [Pseudomonadota bacterium]